MDDFTQKMLERTRARREMLQQKIQEHNGPNPLRKRKPLTSQNSEEQLSSKKLDESDLRAEGHSESPNKRTRTDREEDISENLPQSYDEDDSVSGRGIERKDPKPKQHLSDRMQKILNQRKVWEAEEQGQDVSYDCSHIPSPIHHEPRAPESRRSHSLEHQGRKRRLAALADRVKGWEDDIAHHDPPKTPETEKTPMYSKPPTGKIHAPVSSTPIEKIVAQKASQPTANSKIAKCEEKELNLDSLAKFAVVGKSPAKGAASKPPNKSAIQICNNSTTVLQTRQQVIVVNTSHERVDKELIQDPRSFQQRVVDLKRNGCDTGVVNMNSSSATAFMEQIRAERQKELEQLKNRKIHGMNVTGKSISQIESKATELENHNKEETLMAVEEEVKADVLKVDGEESTKLGTKSLTEMQQKLENEEEAEEAFPSVSVEPQQEDEESMQYEDEADTSTKDNSVFIADEMEEQEEGYGDSLLDEEDPKEQDLSVTEEKSELKEQGEEACQMIDDLFEGVLSAEEEEMLTPSSRSHSPLTIPSLARVKSKKEIRTELTVRNQTCNEAEDSHSLSQPSKFQRTCLSKSNSTESIVSLCQEKDFPVYTISSYRTEKRKSMSKRPEKRVVRNEAAAAKETTMKRNAQDAQPVTEVISDMMEQVSRQQRIIQQASAALNCCYDAHHGKGTITEVEAEKLLLIVSEKRLALLADIQRLKQKRSTRPDPTYKPCKGKVIVGNLRLPMRTEYIFSIANRREASEVRNHYYFILVRSGHKMFATQLVSTLDDLSGDSLVFTDQFAIDNLVSDFQITIEVYSLNHRTRADGIPMQDKAKGKLSGILHKSLTPRKLRSSSKRTSHMPAMMSPGGPNAIRISNFSLIGSTTVSLSGITGKKFTLQKVPFLSPISGQLLCTFTSNFQSEIEQKGFLTMFDDVGGLGAWHRRWCVLRQGRLFSWTYPDDENHKKPLMTVTLRECISREIITVERILCARPNTFELRTMRPRRQGDKQNLISQDTGSVITTKHWLSADTKEERVAWIDFLNQALVDVRAWDMEALKPFK